MQSCIAFKRLGLRLGFPSGRQGAKLKPTQNMPRVVVVIVILVYCRVFLIAQCVAGARAEWTAGSVLRRGDCEGRGGEPAAWHTDDTGWAEEYTLPVHGTRTWCWRYVSFTGCCCSRQTSWVQYLLILTFLNQLTALCILHSFIHSFIQEKIYVAF